MKLLNFLDNIADKIWDYITDKFWKDDPSMNHHVGFAIWSHPFTDSYEHQDENGNCVKGPALVHDHHGSYDEYAEAHPSDLEIEGRKIKEKIEKWSQGNG